MPLDTSIAEKLFAIGAIKFGSFTLKSGILSPIYIDLRLVVSYPDLLREIAEEMWKKIKDIKKECLCGVPYTALPIATAISLAHGIPMVMRRKEAKDYGTKKMIEGVFKKGDHCVVIEDLVTSGTSVFETIAPLEAEGLSVTDVVVLIDREQGGKKNLEDKGYRCHSVLKLTEALDQLEKKKKITPETSKQVAAYLRGEKK
jgi:uridine monophosphate synthetase